MSKAGKPNFFLPDLFEPLVKEEHFSPGDVICKEGTIADSLFVIKQGEVEIRKVVDRDNGRYKLISVLESGAFFGEMAAFLGHPRSADAVAKTGVSISEIRKDDFSALLASDPLKAYAALEFLTTVLMERLRLTTSELATVYETGKLVASSRGIAELSEHVMHNIFNAVPSAEAGFFVIWNEFNNEFEIVRLKGLDIEPGTAIPAEDPLASWLAKNRDAFISTDISDDKRVRVNKNNLYAGKSLLASPFVSRDRMLGFIVLLNRDKNNAFSYDQMILLSAVCGYVSIALENLRYVQEEIDRSRLNQAKSSTRH